ncbi:MAG: HEAT repeat domain-containing protein [Candidatus Micrarchaeota archaeon]
MSWFGEWRAKRLIKKLEPFVSQETKDRLAALGASALSPLVEQIRRGNIDCIDILSRIDDPKASGKFRPLLRDPHYFIGEASAKHFFNREFDGLDDNDRVLCLLMLKRDDDILAMGKGAVGPLMESTDSIHSNIREIAVTLLGKIGDPAAMDALIKRIGDTNDGSAGRSCVVDAAFAALKKLRCDPLPAIIASIPGQMMWAKANIARELGTFDDERAIDALIGMLDDPENRVVDEASRSLPRLGPKAVPPVMEALLSPSLQKRYMAQVTLRNLASNSEIPMDDIEGTLRRFVAEADDKNEAKQRKKEAARFYRQMAESVAFHKKKDILSEGEPLPPVKRGKRGTYHSMAPGRPSSLRASTGRRTLSRSR